MTTVITSINQKGGVGKTTTAMLTAETLAGGCLAGATTETRVLLIDFDPLGTLSDIMLERYGVSAEYTVTDWLTGAGPALASWTRLGYSSISILPADNRLEDVLSEMAVNPAKVFDLRNMVKQYCGLFDLIVIDAPPSLSALAWAAIIAADLVVVPTLLDRTSVKGAQNVMRQIDDLRAQLGMAPAMIGTVANMADMRVVKHRDALSLLAAAGMPRLLGTLPVRQGRNAFEALRAAFQPISNELESAITAARTPA